MSEQGMYFDDFLATLGMTLVGRMEGSSVFRAMAELLFTGVLLVCSGGASPVGSLASVEGWTASDRRFCLWREVLPVVAQGVCG